MPSLVLVTAALAAASAAPHRIPRERVLDEMRRSVRSFDAAKDKHDAQTYVRQVLNGPVSSSIGRLVVINGKIYGNKDMAYSGEGPKFVVMATHALRRRDTGNVALLHLAGASRRCFPPFEWQKKKWAEAPGWVPTTLVARKHAEEDCGILVPNPYFVDSAARATGIFNNNLYGHHSTPSVLNASAARPWARRKATAFWRGKLRKATKSCVSEIGNYARFEAMGLTLKNHAFGDRLFDVKSTFGYPLHGEWYNASWLQQRNCLDVDKDFGGPKKFEKLVARLEEAVDHEKMYIEEDYCDYKMLLHLPGGTSGSYSRNLNHLWASGGVVLFWKQSAPEHYYAGLEDGVSHAVVDMVTARDVATRVLKDEAFAARLRKGAAAVQRDLVCDSCLTDYVSEVLLELRSWFKGELALDGRAALRETLRGIECTKMGLVELVLANANGVGGGIRYRKLKPAATLPGEGEDPTCLELLDEAYPPNAEGAEASKAVRNVADAFGRGVVEERLEALEKRIKGLEKHRKEGKGRSGWWG